MFSSLVKKNYWNSKSFDFNLVHKKPSIKSNLILIGIYSFITIPICYMAKKNYDKEQRLEPLEPYGLDW